MLNDIPVLYAVYRAADKHWDVNASEEHIAELAAILKAPVVKVDVPGLELVRAVAAALYEAMDDGCLETPRPLEEHVARFHLRAALEAMEARHAR